MGQRGSVNWNALTALAALITAAAAVGMSLMLAISLRSDWQRSRFTSALDTLWRLDADWNSVGMQDARSAAATALLAGRSAREIDVVLDFFDEVALLLQRGAVDEELVWYEFYHPMASYWYASQKYMSKESSDGKMPWEHLAVVIPRMLDLESQRHHRPVEEAMPTMTQLRDFLNTEIDAGTCEEGPESEVRQMPS